MSVPGQPVGTAPGAFALRPAGPDDEGFLKDLFHAVQGGPLLAAGLPAAAVRDLVALQERARAGAYAQAYPQARSLVVEHGGEAVGRLILDEAPGLVRVVLLELRPDRQGRGLGRALMEALAAGWDGAGITARLSAFSGNAPALALWRGLGFREEGPERNGYQDFVRPPGGSRGPPSDAGGA